MHEMLSLCFCGGERTRLPQHTMKALWADTLTEVDLSGKRLGLAEALELRELLKASSKLIACNLLQNEFDFESAKMLAAIGTEKRIMLSGKILPDTYERAEADFSSQVRNFTGLGPVDATLIASDALVSRVLTKLDIRGNPIGDEGATALGADGDGEGDNPLLGLRQVWFDVHKKCECLFGIACRRAAVS